MRLPEFLTALENVDIKWRLAGPVIRGSKDKAVDTYCPITGVAGKGNIAIADIVGQKELRMDSRLSFLIMCAADETLFIDKFGPAYDLSGLRKRLLKACKLNDTN